MHATDLYFVFAAGLLGSAHCVGMCGGFVLAVTTTKDRTAGVLHQGLYFLGKTVTYTILGAVVGIFGAALATGFAGWQQALSIVAGLLMLAIGLGLVGLTRRFEAFGKLAALPVFRQAMGYFLKRRNPTGTFGLGLLNGLLPCGLVYGLLVKAAATGTWLGGALTMFTFGIATIPALFVLGLTGHLLRPVWRTRFNVAAVIVVIVLGLITITRGIPTLSHSAGHGHATFQHQEWTAPDPHSHHPE